MKRENWFYFAAGGIGIKIVISLVVIFSGTYYDSQVELKVVRGIYIIE